MFCVEWLPEQYQFKNTAPIEWVINGRYVKKSDILFLRRTITLFVLLIKINKRRLFGKSINLTKGPRKLSKVYTFAYARNSCCS